MTTAMVFPGMGPTRFSDLGRFLLLNTFARDLLPIADEALGYSVFDRFRESGEDYSEAAQVAFMVASTALAQWARAELGAEAEICAGPSFGEKPLMAFCGALDFPDAVVMTARLARCTADYFATEHRDIVTQSFVRAPVDGLRELLDGMDERGEWYDLSCRLDQGFEMISLREEHLEAFTARLRKIGSLPLYAMRPPMHSSLFTGLRDRAAVEVIDALPLRDPDLPVLADQDGRLIDTAEGLRTMLLDHFVKPVDWPAVLAELDGRGVTRLVVAGPDALFSRVECAVRTFDVVLADPKHAMRPKAGV
ncbi:[acyl-carrier-protein] S-malonyltransferase [Streptomyces sp. SPB162]|nr:[acyl-carrier-protein] S-malonyltransferase [Streptomyces sp. SPB162]